MKPSSGINSNCRVGESSSSSASRMDDGRKRRKIGSGLVNDEEDGQRNDYDGRSATVTQEATNGGCPPDVVSSMVSDRSKGNRVSHRFGSMDDQEQVMMVVPMMVPTPCTLPTMRGNPTARGGSHALMSSAPLSTSVPFRQALTFDSVNGKAIYPPLQYQAVTPLTQRLRQHAPPSMVRYLGLSHDRMMQQPGEQHY